MVLFAAMVVLRCIRLLLPRRAQIVIYELSCIQAIALCGISEPTDTVLPILLHILALTEYLPHKCLGKYISVTGSIKYLVYRVFGHSSFIYDIDDKNTNILSSIRNKNQTIYLFFATLRRPFQIGQASALCLK